MPFQKGHKRYGGRATGTPNKSTRQEKELLEIWRQTMAQHFEELAAVQLEAAKGVSHMMARDKSGKWQQVTDPKVMAACLDSGETFYRISAQNPNGNVLRDIMDRLFGQPKQTHEVQIEGLEDRKARLRAALDENTKLK